MILYFSMKDLLSKNKISVNRTQEIKAPVLYNDDIEEIAMDIIKPQVDELVSLLQRCGVNDEVPPCIIDPYKVAENMGLCIERGYTGDEYALIDIEGRIVTISDKTQLYYHCARFGMGHEVGHYVLHQDVMVLARKTRQTINPTEKNWMERQANHFASCLLMPAPVIRLLFDHFVKRHLGTVSYPLSYKGSCFNNCILGPLAKTMNVSAEAATIRLEKLGLVCSQQLLPSYLPAS
jgi:Zn-dependent peptidase ImmA (M78 family)